MRFLLLGLPLLVAGCIDLEVARFARIRVAPAEIGAPSLSAPTGVGRSCVTLVGLFPVTALPQLDDAVAAAAGASTLRDAVVRYELRYVPLIGGRGCYVVEGHAP